MARDKGLNMEVNKQIKILLHNNQSEYMIVPHSCNAIWSESFRTTFPDQANNNFYEITELVYKKYGNSWKQWELV